MAYSINFSDFINKEGITINDNLVNTETSLGFPGRNQKGYAITIAENFLHLLENFSKSTPPLNPVKGQLWYDSSQNVESLMVYNGSSWKSSGALKKGTSAPTENISGDLWVDTTNQQLKLYTGAGWILVGPTFSSGLRTGAIAEKIKDSTKEQIEHVVLMNYVNDTIVSIISSSEFTPQSVIAGFTTLKKGVNLNANLNKFWGTSEKSESLIVGSTVVPATNFLRSDVSNVTFYDFSIKNNSGLNIGDNNQLKLNITDNKGIISYTTPGSRLDFKINYGLSTANETTLVSLDSTTGSVLIGIGNSYTGATLSVLGSGRFTEKVEITKDTQSTNTSTGSLIVAGGTVIAKTLRVGGELYVDDQMYTKSIVPKITNVSNIGTSNLKFSNVYATTFNGNLNGNVIGTITGSITGTASKLVSSTQFKIAGDVSDSTGVSFDGPTLDGSPLVFNTVISSSFITNKTEVTSTVDSDEILLNRSYLPDSNIPAGVYKTTKAALMKHLSFVPVGSIFPFAGATVPDGYVLCDGSEKSVGTYKLLFDVIEYTYTVSDRRMLVGGNTFQVPDLRGRFPLGLDNMNNKDYVANGDVDPLLVPSNGWSGNKANRVTDASALNLGEGAGRQQINLTSSQLPEHSHKLTGSTGEQFYAINEKSTEPTSSEAVLGNGVNDTTQSQYLPNTGGINQTTIGRPVTIMNPYLAINYIIYTGVYKL